MSAYRRFIPALILILTLAACAAPTPPASTPTPQPSPTPTSTPAPTATAEASATPSPTASPSPTVTLPPSLTPPPTSSPTPTVNPTLAYFQYGSVGSRTDGLGTGRLLIVNQTGKPEIIVTLKGTTLRREQPVYYSYTVARQLVIDILWGTYGVMIQIPGHPNLFASFAQQSKDKTTFYVQDKKLLIIGP